MKPDDQRLLENSLIQADALKPEPERDALMAAKARQDRSYVKLDNWITATIAELTE